MYRIILGGNMKKASTILLSTLMCVSLLLSTCGTAQAGTVSAANLPDPTLTLLTGAPDYAAAVTPLAKLPGVTTMDSGTFVPVGYETGEKQFEGSGLILTGFNYGSASLCFPLAGTSSGWGGQVGKWNGSKWDLLSTTINPPNGDDSYAWACTVIYGDGTYAFLRWIAEPDLLTKSIPDCGYAILGAMPGMVEYSDIDGVFTGTIISILVITDPSVEISGMTIEVSVTFDPKAISISPASTEGVILPWGAGFYIIGPTNPITFSVSEGFDNMYLHLDFGSCKQTVAMSIG
jgi:hypothetical protein